MACTPAASGNITVANTRKWSPDCNPSDMTCIEASLWKITLGSTVQAKCQAGTYSLGAATQCTSCPTGTASLVVGAGSWGTCEECPPGSYANVAGSTMCTGCGAGNYGERIGAKSFADGCAACPQGTWSSNDVASLCQPCGQGK